MANTKSIALRVDSNLKQKITDAAAQLGTTESALARSIISEYFGELDPGSIGSMSSRLGTLEREYDRLAEVVFGEQDEA